MHISPKKCIQTIDATKSINANSNPAGLELSSVTVGVDGGWGNIDAFLASIAPAKPKCKVIALYPQAEAMAA